jgi:hypothetical protein
MRPIAAEVVAKFVSLLRELIAAPALEDEFETRGS